jgi:hypothetical protein
MGLLKGSTRTFVPMNGGVDESSPANSIAPEDCAVMSNFRISKDGKRIEKRLGLAEEVTNFGEDVYGYATYYNNANTYCQLAVLESGISRKVGSAAWSSIHTWSPVTLTGSIDPTASVNVVGVGTKFLSELRTGNGLVVTGETKTVSTITDDTHCTVTAAFSDNANDTSPDKTFTLAHPVNVLEIQGKQFIIHEDASRMVHIDGNDYQIGITAPTTLPTATTTTPPEITMGVNDLFAYANTGALDAVWTDADAGNGQSTIATTGPATQGPDAHDLYLKLSCSAWSSTTIAKRTQTLATIPASAYTLELNTYFDLCGTDKRYAFRVNIYNGTYLLPLYFRKRNVSIVDSKNAEFSFGTYPKADVWQSWKFVVDGTDSNAIKVKGYCNGLFMKEVTYNYATTATEGLVEIAQDNRAAWTGDVITSYVDNFKISASTTITPASESDTTEAGKYRYALTYFRGDNYGCESNPIKSFVGAATFTGGAGNDDMDTSGTYTGNGTKSFRVQIDGTGTPDTYKWSEDGGTTWVSTLNKISGTVYLSYGIILTFGNTTHHTSGDYWDFTGYSWAATPVDEQVNLASLPVSSDPQVTGRKIYRTTAGGTIYYWCATINDNTSTTFVDMLPDMALGQPMGEDHDIAPNGKFSAWWDNRLWISGDDIVYYSATSIPEHFDISSRYITVQKGDPGDEITGLVPFKDALYVFRKKSIYSIQANPYGYGIYLVENHTGCRAPWSMIEVNNTLMFISDRGIEVFNGADCYPMALSDKIERTIKTIDTSKYDYITATLVRDKYEVWFSIPDRTSGSAVTIVYNYIYGKFYYFSFYKTPSYLASCENSSYALVTKMGTRDGYLCLCESTYRDNATAITATYRKGWMGGDKYENVRRIDCEFECPTGMTLTTNVYVNFQKTAARTVTLTGSTPSSTDIELRRPIKGFGELGQRAEWWTVEFTNAENLGGALKINNLSLYHYTTDTKGKIYGD